LNQHALGRFFLACFVFTQHKQANSFRIFFSAPLFKFAVAIVKIFAFDCLAVLSHFDFDLSEKAAMYGTPTNFKNVTKIYTNII
jgi:hypothetical protein